MNEIEKQILVNQMKMMNHIYGKSNQTYNELEISIKKTLDLLKEKESKEEPCCEMPEREQPPFITNREIKEKFAKSKQGEGK